MSNKYKKVCTTLNYIGHAVILGSEFTGRISFSTFVNWFYYRTYEFYNRIQNLCNKCKN